MGIENVTGAYLQSNKGQSSYDIWLLQMRIQKVMESLSKAEAERVDFKALNKFLTNLDAFTKAENRMDLPIEEYFVNFVSTIKDADPKLHSMLQDAQASHARSNKVIDRLMPKSRIDAVNNSKERKEMVAEIMAMLKDGIDDLGELTLIMSLVRRLGIFLPASVKRELIDQLKMFIEEAASAPDMDEDDFREFVAQIKRIIGNLLEEQVIGDGEIDELVKAYGLDEEKANSPGKVRREKEDMEAQRLEDLRLEEEGREDKKMLPDDILKRTGDLGIEKQLREDELSPTPKVYQGAMPRSIQADDEKDDVMRVTGKEDADWYHKKAKPESVKAEGAITKGDLKKPKYVADKLGEYLEDSLGAFEEEELYGYVNGVLDVLEGFIKNDMNRMFDDLSAQAKKFGLEI